MMAQPGGGFDIDSIPLLMLLVVSFMLSGGPITAGRTAQLWIDQSCGEQIVFLYEYVSSSRAEYVISSPHGTKEGAAEKEEGLYKTMPPE